MTRAAIISLALFGMIACSESEQRRDVNDRILAISFPGVPNPPTKNLVRGTGNFKEIEANRSPEGQISEAFLRCGLTQLSWTDYATDGGSRLIIPDTEKSRSAIKCVARTFPLDFYAEPEQATKSDLEALKQTPDDSTNEK